MLENSAELFEQKYLSPNGMDDWTILVCKSTEARGLIWAIPSLEKTIQMVDVVIPQTFRPTRITNWSIVIELFSGHARKLPVT